MTRTDMHSTDENPSGLVRYMLEHGREVTSVKLRASEIREQAARDRAWFMMPHEVADALLKGVHYTTRHANDLLISLRSMAVEIMDGSIEGVRLIGFREDGVDHTAYVESRFDEWYSWHNYGMMEAYYRAMYLVQWRQDDDMYAQEGDLKVRVLDVHKQHPYKDPFEPPKESDSAGTGAQA